MGSDDVEDLRHRTVTTSQIGWVDEVTRDSRDHAMRRRLVRGAARAADHHS